MIGLAIRKDPSRHFSVHIHEPRKASNRDKRQWVVIVVSKGVDVSTWAVFSSGATLNSISTLMVPSQSARGLVPRVRERALI
jgi:hypothetical protein